MADVSLLFNVLAKDSTAAGLNSASGRMAKFKSAVNVASVAILGTAAVMGKKAIDTASDTAESSSKVQTLLGKSSAAAMEFSEASATAYGISKREALNAVGAMAAVDRAMGTGEKAAAKLAVEYTKLSADLGSFNNASSAEVQEALTASLSGEYEMLKKYGIVVNDTTLAAEAQRIGMEKTGATWDSAQKRQLSYNIIMRSTKAAQGDFARTSGGLANQTKIMSARMEDLQGKIGAKLLPVVVQIAGKFNELLGWIEQNETKAKILGGVVLGLAGAIVATSVAMKVWNALQAIAAGASKAWAAAQWLLNAAMSANPITLIVLAIVALIAIVVLIATKTTWFQQIWRAAWGAITGAVSATLGWIRRNWPTLLAILTGPVGIAVLFITKKWDAIKSGASKMKNGLVGIFSGIGSIITAPFRAAVDGVRALWNSTLGGKGFSAPSWIPGIGGKGFTIPYLADGGTITGSGMAVVGEAGPELLSLGRGAQVTPLTGKNRAIGGGGGVVRIELDLTGADDDLLKRLRKQIRVNGGNVQVVLGGAR